MEHDIVLIIEMDTEDMEWEYLESFKKLFWRRMKKVKLSLKIINKEVLERSGEKMTLLNIILRSKSNLIGYFLKIDRLVGLVVSMSDY